MSQVTNRQQLSEGPVHGSSPYTGAGQDLVFLWSVTFLV